LEQYAQDGLRGCSGSLFNDEKAFRILQTCVVGALDVQLAYYRSLSDYDPKWIGEIVEKTISSAVCMLPFNANIDFIAQDLFRTIETHLKRKAARAKIAKVERGDRKGLRDSYLARFPNRIQILDICWAAGQHYSEWKRWLRNAVKDGSAPDRAFRELLATAKLPQEYRKQPRPNGWK